MIRTLLAVTLAAAGVSSSFAAEDADAGWTTILDAASFKDWKLAPGDAADQVAETATAKEVQRKDGTKHGKWAFVDGVLTGEGEVSHIFSPRSDYADFAFKAEIKISDKGNSGMYFRAKFGNGWPDGYEAQINATMSDPQKSGSLYGIVKIDQAPVGPETWYTQEVDATGDHIVIKINDAVIVDTHDGKRTVGHVAFQQHNDGSVVQIRNVRIKETKPAADH